MDAEPRTHVLTVSKEEFGRIESKARSFLVRYGVGDNDSIGIDDILFLDEIQDGRRTGARVVASVTDVHTINRDESGSTIVLGINVERR